MSDNLGYWLVDGLTDTDSRFTVGGKPITSAAIDNVISTNGASLSAIAESDAPAGLNLANPATMMANKIKAFFAGTDGITVSFEYAPTKQMIDPRLFGCNHGYYMPEVENVDSLDDVEPLAPLVSIFVTDPSAVVDNRAEYLNRTIKHVYDFGGIKLYVVVFDACAGAAEPMNKPSSGVSMEIAEQLEIALKGNPNFLRYFGIYVELFNMTYHFLEFQPKVVFYQEDNFSNVRGFSAALPENLFREIFDSTYTYYGGDEPETRNTLDGFLISTYTPTNKMK